MKKDIAAIGISLILIGVSSSFISAPSRASSEVNFAPPEIALGYDAPAPKPVKKREKSVSRSKIRLSPIESPNRTSASTATPAASASEERR